MIEDIPEILMIICFFIVIETVILIIGASYGVFE